VLKHVADWRWLLDREDSPWYPTLRLFRQPERGAGWKPVFARIEQELRALVSRPASARVLAPPRARPAPRIEISWGELLDRLTMLEIRRERSALARAELDREHAALSAMAADIAAEHPQIAALREELRGVNEALWSAESALRAEDSSSEQRLANLARALREGKAERSRLMRAIDACIAPVRTDAAPDA
jgi:hypothetical protein